MLLVYPYFLLIKPQCYMYVGILTLLIIRIDYSRTRILNGSSIVCVNKDPRDI